MIVKPSIGFLNTNSDAQLVTDAETIVNSLTGNSDYPTPAPALTVITAAIDAFQVAISNAAGGGVELTVIKDAKRAELVSLLRQLASYITVTCNGDMAKLLSSGYPIQKPGRTPIGVLPAPAAPRLSQGSRKGELDAVTPPVFGAYTYNWRVALASAPNVYVQQSQTTAARTTFAGLTPGQMYRVQLNAVGSAGTSDWSDDSELMVV